VQRRIFGPKRKEIRGGWRRLQNEELHNLYTSPNIEGYEIKENAMGSTRSTHKIYKNCTQFSSENLKESGKSKDLDKSRKLILKWILGK
jgi:hypothetical protein